MASAFTHAFAALAGGKIFTGEKMPTRFWWLAVVCSILPDADAIGFKFGIPYESFWGHRGFTHSLVFALLLSFAVVLIFLRSYARTGSRRWCGLVAFFFLVTASHALLDMLTSGGHGVAIFAPFDNSRHFFPWHPIRVSPIGITQFFGEWGLRVIKSELLWVWLPLGSVALIAIAVRRFGGRRSRVTPKQHPVE